MSYKLYNKDYTYVDVRDGTVYPTHTCTDADEEDRQSGADLRFAISDGGDCTKSHKRELSIEALGASRIKK